MTIKIKLLLSFFVVILLTIILGVVSYNTIHSLSEKWIPGIKANEKINSSMLSLRKNEKDFFSRSLKDPRFYQTGQSQYLDDFKANYERLRQELEVVTVFSKQHGLQNEVADIDRLVSSYKSSFLRVVEAKKDRGFKSWGKIGDLRQSVHDVEEKLATLGKQETLMVSMLMNRRHEKDYLLRNDVSYQAKLAERVEEFKSILQTSNLSEEDKNGMAILIGDYKRKFDSLVAIDEQIGRTERDGLVGSYRSTVRELEPLLKKIEQQFEQEADAQVRKGVLVIVATLIAVVVLSLLLVVYLSAKISKPLVKMSEVGKKVAAGDLNAQMPVVKTKDEVKDIHVVMTSLIGALRYHMNKS